jgi:hypothetical protein
VAAPATAAAPATSASSPALAASETAVGGADGAAEASMFRAPQEVLRRLSETASGLVQRVSAAMAEGGSGVLDREAMIALKSLDDQLLKVLKDGDISLLRVAWVLQLPVDYVMPRRQTLEELQLELEAKGEALTPFLKCDEAVALVDSGERAVGVLSHGWLTPGHCDPQGAKVVVVQAALRQYPHIEGLFWECAPIACAPLPCAPRPRAPLACAPLACPPPHARR